jgi:hypothetical protein
VRNSLLVATLFIMLDAERLLYLSTVVHVRNVLPTSFDKFAHSLKRVYGCEFVVIVCRVGKFLAPNERIFQLPSKFYDQVCIACREAARRSTRRRFLGSV